ncbi:MAG: hypothetical protein ABS68_12380 [Niastella sp. SCN 39-18]|mgnify:FL=1|nr:FKBP-type peptidyl-prolyl cis-trans isomerase [Sphingobacteriales bacterium]ODT51593.1 MAG: hypothetical protein ABS68_12380 [Niastella sp. SCN 39-18]OJW08264.1 MAG: hypothetical protein BGO53_05370 [Sphingobacteriales bacterium 39-19]
MKKITQLVILASLSLPVFAQQKKTVKTVKTTSAVTSPVLKNGIDSFSYAAGINIAQSMKAQGIENINNALMQKAMEDVFANKKLMMDEQQAGMTLQQKLQEFAQKKINAEKVKGAAFLAKNKTRPGVITLPDGLQYEILKEGNGPKPIATDTVVVDYAGTLINGAKVDNSFDRGAPVHFVVTQVIKGWTEALQLMPKGSKWKVYIPSELGYGDRGNGAVVPGGSTLIFEIELHDIKPLAKE